MIRLVSYVALLTSAVAQQLQNPEKNPKIGYIGPPGEGNECKIIASSEGQILVCTSANGEITALDHATLDTLWKYPENSSQDITGETGVAFSPETNSIIYGTTEDAGATCRVHALSASREMKEEWDILLDGKCSGTPVISSSGKYVFVTHNINRSGTFTVLEVDENGQVDVMFEHQDGQDEKEPYSPPGIYHNPDFGNYGNSTVGGLSNDNDIIVWANRPYEGEEGVGAAAVYAFQFPIVFDGSAVGFSVTTLQRMNDPWKTVVPPTLTSNGLRMYWGVTKSKILGWSNEDPRDRYTRKAPRNVGFARGKPNWKAVSARVATTQSLAEPIIFTATASNEFYAMSHTLDVKWNVTVTSGVVNQAQISPDDKVVYFVDEIGLAYAYTVEGVKIWSELVIASDGVKAGYTQSIDGSHLYFVSNSGIVSSFRVAMVSTPAPVSPAPVSPAPVSPAPVSSAPVSPAPVSQAPVLSDPVEVDPVTSAPLEVGPTTPAPIMSVTETPVPTSQETDSPVVSLTNGVPTTAAPYTAAPITAAPITAAPTQTGPTQPADTQSAETASTSGATCATKGLKILIAIIFCLVM